MASERVEHLKERALDEFRRFLLMFVYLWVVFGLFVLNESLVLGERNMTFAFQGFAVVNAAILAKVMLVAEDLKFGRRFDHLPLIYPVIYKAAVFATVFILFHTMERIAIGMFGGKTAADSLPHIGGGTWQGGLTVWAVVAVSLLPFFALHEISRYMGPSGLWILMFRSKPKDGHLVR